MYIYIYIHGLFVIISSSSIIIIISIGLVRSPITSIIISIISLVISIIRSITISYDQYHFQLLSVSLTALSICMYVCNIIYVNINIHIYIYTHCSNSIYVT